MSVNTPTKTRGLGAGKAADLTYWESAARTIADVSRSDKIVVQKSTVPVKTAEAIEKILAHNGNGVGFHVLSNQEFLAEGTAVQNLLSPDRMLKGVYAHWVPDDRIITTNLWSAELSKLASNALMAQRTPYRRCARQQAPMSRRCARQQAPMSRRWRSPSARTPHVGSRFLNAGVGFGGSCFQKDVLSLVYVYECNGLPEAAGYWRQVVSMSMNDC